MDKIPPGNLPLRVNQLDAASYDDYIFDILWGKLQDIIKYLKGSALLHTYVHEVKAVIKLALWLVVFRRQHATLGQQLLDLRYTPSRYAAGGGDSKELALISNLQSYLYVVCNVVVPYAMSKLGEWQSHRNFSTMYPMINKVYAALNGIWCCLNLANFVVFLQRGTYLHLYERLCGIRTIHPKGRQLREVGFEFFNREIVWHGFAEFMVFIMPYINLRRFKSWFSQGSQGTTTNQSKYCLICDSYPTNPQQITGCRHIYCYHCAATLLAADGVLECKPCDTTIRSSELLLPAVHLVDSFS